MRRDTVPGSDEPLEIEADPQEQLRALLTPESTLPAEDGIEPILDD